MSHDKASGFSSANIETKSRFRPVTILDENNFGVWKWNLKYNLKTQGVYECVISEGKGTQAQQDEAMLEIISSINDKIKMRVSHCKGPYELYQAIESFYTNKTSFQATSLHMRLSSFKFKSSELIPEGISEIQNVVSKLKNLGENVSDHMVEGIVLAALPSSYRTFVTVWKGMSSNERTLSNLYSRIMAEVEDNRLFNSREDKALFTQKRSPNGGKPSNFRKFKSKSPKKNSSEDSSQFCRYCKAKGHSIDNCRKLKKKKEEEASSTKKPDSTETRKDHAMIAGGSHVSSWIADSGASAHMTSRRD